MKNIYTSYLNCPYPWKLHGYTRVRVCRWVHAGQEKRYDIECACLYPSADQLKEKKHLTHPDIWECEYNQTILDKLDPTKLYESLPNNCVLLCHEKTEKDGSVLCHRRLVAQWFERSLNISIPEWLSDTQIITQQQIQIQQTLLEF